MGIQGASHQTGSLAHEDSGENGECGYSKNVPLLVVEHESSGCVVVSSTL